MGHQSQDRQGSWHYGATADRCPRRRGDEMKRREFITLFGGAAAAWPLAARAQQSDRMRRIGVLLPYPPSDTEWKSRVGALQQELQRLGWTLGRNIEFDERWTTDAM